MHTFRPLTGKRRNRLNCSAERRDLTQISTPESRFSSCNNIQPSVLGLASRHLQDIIQDATLLQAVTFQCLCCQTGTLFDPWLRAGKPRSPGSHFIPAGEAIGSRLRNHPSSVGGSVRRSSRFIVAPGENLSESLIRRHHYDYYQKPQRVSRRSGTRHCLFFSVNYRLCLGHRYGVSKTVPATNDFKCGRH